MLRCGAVQYRRVPERTSASSRPGWSGRRTFSHKRIQRQQRKIRKVEVQPSVKDENSSISVLPAELSKTLALAKYEAVDQYCNNPPRLLEGSGNITLFL